MPPTDRWKVTIAVNLYPSAAGILCREKRADKRDTVSAFFRHSEKVSALESALLTASSKTWEVY